MRVQAVAATKVTSFTHYQNTAKIGLQVTKILPKSHRMAEFEIEGNFYTGLNTRQLMKQWECAMSCVVSSSSQVWKDSYAHHNLANSLLDLVIDKTGSVMENDKLVAFQRLEYYCTQDFASDDAFTASVFQ